VAELPFLELPVDPDPFAHPYARCFRLARAGLLVFFYPPRFAGGVGTTTWLRATR
jgi:hypothetical protein